jgi:hypothetical protein
MANPESTDSPQVKLFRQCRGEFEKRDLSSIGNAIHKDFRYVSYPRSLGHPEQTKEEWLERYAGIMSLWAAAPEVSYIGYSSAPFAPTKFLPQPTHRVIVDIPGKLVVHVRI